MYAFGLENGKEYQISVTGKLSENIFTKSQNINFIADFGVISGLVYSRSEKKLQWQGIAGAKTYRIRVFPGEESVSKAI